MAEKILEEIFDEFPNERDDDHKKWLNLKFQVSTFK